MDFHTFTGFPYIVHIFTLLKMIFFYVAREYNTKLRDNRMWAADQELKINLERPNL